VSKNHFAARGTQDSHKVTHMSFHLVNQNGMIKSFSHVYKSRKAHSKFHFKKTIFKVARGAMKMTYYTIIF